IGILGVLAGIWLAAYGSFFLSGVLLSLLLIASLFSFSRSALIAGLCSIFILCLGMIRISFTRSVAILFLVFVIGGMGTALTFDLWTARTHVVGRLESASVSERMQSLTDASYLIRHYPFFGVGP